mgnify:FL=1
MQQVKYNIEYAHIYADQQFGRDQDLGVLEAKKFVNGIGQPNCILTVLVDEYNPKNTNLDEDAYVQRLNMAGLNPDVVMHESDLPHLHELLQPDLQASESRSINEHVRMHGKYPCAYLIALWDLYRLGLLLPKQPYGRRKTTRLGWAAQTVVTILPRTYQETEQRAIKHISRTPYKHAVDRIQHIFF